MRRTLAAGALTVMLMGVAAPADAAVSDRPKRGQPTFPPGQPASMLPEQAETPLTGRLNQFK